MQSFFSCALPPVYPGQRQQIKARYSSLMGFVPVSYSCIPIRTTIWLHCRYTVYPQLVASYHCHHIVRQCYSGAWLVLLHILQFILVVDSILFLFYTGYWRWYQQHHWRCQQSAAKDHHRQHTTKPREVYIVAEQLVIAKILAQNSPAILLSAFCIMNIEFPNGLTNLYTVLEILFLNQCP